MRVDLAWGERNCGHLSAFKGCIATSLGGCASRKATGPTANHDLCAHCSGMLVEFLGRAKRAVSCQKLDFRAVQLRARCSEPWEG